MTPREVAQERTRIILRLTQLLYAADGDTLAAVGAVLTAASRVPEPKTDRAVSAYDDQLTRTLTRGGNIRRPKDVLRWDRDRR